MPSTATLKPVPKSARSSIGELITEAGIDDLNRSLDAHGVDVSQIIMIFKIPAQPIANGAPARYRVLYRRG